MQSFDAIIVGGGIIGLSLARELRRQNLDVLVLDRAQPGGEASTAGAGMLAAAEVEGPLQLQALAQHSAQLFPHYVNELEAESGVSLDFQRSGAICLTQDFSALPPAYERLSPDRLAELEPALTASSLCAAFSAEDFVDPRTLLPALIEAVKRQGVHVHGGSEVVSLRMEGARVAGVKTAQTAFASPIVVNCAGAWANQIGGVSVPTRPVKGHMLALLPARPHPIRHVIRHRETDAYLVPRRDGHIAVGSTLEEADFDKNVVPETIQRLHQLAADLFPELGEARIHHAWAGLRPGTPDKLPILGATSLPGYFVATGHFRNGILLAPATARVMSELITGTGATLDLAPFAPARF